MSPRRRSSPTSTGRPAALAAALALAAAAAVAGEPAAFRPDTRRLATAPPELRQKLRADPFVYFRYLNTAWASAVCEAFRDQMPALPAALLHGDAHIEQYALTADAHGLDDFDDAARGPALVDLVRFLGSVDLVSRSRGWDAQRDTISEAFLDGYQRALADPSYVPRTPAVVARLRARPARTRAEFLAWGESLMQQPTAQERANFARSLRLVDQFVRELRPHTPERFFELRQVGWLRMGVGSLLTRKVLVRVEGPSARSDDDLLIEAKELSDLAGVPCVQVPLSGEVFRVIASAEQIGRIRHNVLVVTPRRDDQGPEVRDWWLRNWDDTYVEVSVQDVASGQELLELAHDVGAQLGAANLRQSIPALETQLRKTELAAVKRLAPRIRATARRLTDELVASWETWRTQ